MVNAGAPAVVPSLFVAIKLSMFFGGEGAVPAPALTSSPRHHQ
jgi:hypothetical protein